MDNFSYYAVIGKYGLGVFRHWEQVKRIEPYFQKITYRGFDTFKEAEDWAIDMFEDRLPRMSGTILSLCVNQPVFFSKLRNEEDF